MTHCTVIEEGGYIGHCTASESAPGVWEASVLFERKSDLSHTFVNAMRHKIPKKFESRDEAMRAAVAYATERAQTGDVGL
ncbi:hypothetical protein [Trinickia mobilis]|uniref:hypothetical protein n=1 Tax=Trinickia mobilis TaxID=2816356 RepID=UPI001A8FB4E4|nr:hypothetical protein [Trinickia mobilis]